jgi:hypothetical protein
VAVNDGENELPLLADLVGEMETPKWETQGGSELSEPKSDWEDKRERKGKGKKKTVGKDKVVGTGRPDFKQADPRTRKRESTHEFFRHGKNRGDDIFDNQKIGHRRSTRQRPGSGGRKTENGGSQPDPKNVARLGGAGASQGGGKEMEVVKEDEWMAEGDNKSKDGVSATAPRFDSPTPRQKRTPVA